MDTITASLEGLVGATLDYALVLAGLATVAMAAVEFLKALTCARRYFHRRKITAWLNGDAAAQRELADLVIGAVEDLDTWYDQPTDDMFSQLHAAAQLVLEFPEAYPAMYRLLSATGPRKEDSEKWKGALGRLTGEQRDHAAAHFMDVRTRLSNLVTRRVDALRIRVDFLWARVNQAISFTIAAALALWLLTEAGAPQGHWIWRVALAGFAGVTAPLAKDIVSALSGLQLRR